MERTNSGWTLRPLVHSLAHEAVDRRDVPDEVAAAAARAVSARFGEREGTPLDSATQRRVAAYFWGTVRRQSLRHAPSYARRIVRATLAADLEAAGWDGSAIRAELERAGLPA